MKLVLGVMLLAASWSAVALDELWQFDTGQGLPCLPVVMDYQNLAGKGVFVASRMTNSIQVLDFKGTLNATLTRPQRMVGDVALSQALDLLLFEEASGDVVLLDHPRMANFAAQTDPNDRQLAGLIFADLDGDALPEVVRASTNGTLSVFDRKMRPLWQYHTGETITGGIAAAPVFQSTAGVYAVCSDGAVHGISGDGTPLWRCPLQSRGFKSASQRRPLVAQLGGQRPSVVVTDAFGNLFAIDAITGQIQWETRIGRSDAGTPAILPRVPKGRNELVIVDEEGRVTVLDGSGRVVEQGSLPPGEYVPRPLVADVDGDGALEVLAATRNRSIVVATPGGDVKKTLALPGQASQGLVLTDIDEDGPLELLAVTDCGRVVCYATKARHGWTHPGASYALNGSVAPLARAPAPTHRKGRRGARVESVTMRDFVERAPYGAAFVRARNVKGAHAASAIIRQNGVLVGSTFKRVKGDGFYVPFIQTSSQPVTLDISFYNKDGKIIASSSGITTTSGPVRLVDLQPVDDFVQAIGERAEAFVLPQGWKPPVLGGREFWDVCDWPLGTEQAPGALAVAKPSIAMAELKNAKGPFVALNYPGEMAPPLQDLNDPLFLGFGVSNCTEWVWDALQRQTIRQPATREAASRLFEQAYRRVTDQYGQSVFPGQSRGLMHHQLMDWGAPGTFCQAGADALYAPMRFAFLRGASRQYGARPWGVSISTRGCGLPADAPMPDPEWERRVGSPPQLGLRLNVAAFLSGATFIDRYSYLTATSAPTPAPPVVIPRGVPYTPVAFMLDAHHGWQPGHDVFGVLPVTRGNRSISAVMNHVYGCNAQADLQRDHLTSGPYGDMFDVIVTGAGPDTLRQYGIIWPLGDISFSKDQARDLMRYVEHGGILVLDAPLADFVRSYVPAIRFTGETGVATQVQTPLGATAPVAAPYRYHEISPGNARVVAWTDTGSPLVVWRQVGKGLLVLAGTDHWVDETNHLLPVAEALLRALTDAFMPVQVSPNLEVILNRLNDGWIVGVINNNCSPEASGESSECTIQVKAGALLQFKSEMGEFQWNHANNGLTTTIKPGEAGVVRMTLLPASGADKK